MKNSIFIPNRLRSAGRELRLALKQPLNELPQKTFLRAWCSIAYLFPGLHPDGYQDADSGWPRVLRRFAAEAWRRADAGTLADAELYPSDAAWCGLYDRMFPHKPGEIKRRLVLATDFGEPLNV
ncbi:MAG: hypothetical protein ABSE16_15675 [Verrucomicrobiota bacterium]|jgi:hypothetical protein